MREYVVHFPEGRWVIVRAGAHAIASGDLALFEHDVRSNDDGTPNLDEAVAFFVRENIAGFTRRENLLDEA